MHMRRENAPTSTGTRQRLVDTDDVERMGPDTHVEGVLAGRLGDTPAGAYMGGFESFRGDFIVLVRVGEKVVA